STQTYDYFNYSFIPSITQTSSINNWNGQATRGYDKDDQKTLEWLGNYFLDANDHSLRLMAGYSYQYFQSSGMSAENRNFPSDVLSYNNLGTGLWMTEDGRLGYGSYKNDSRLIAFLGRASYSYKDKYMLTASLRYEGSSKFGINHKWGYFPGASVGWRLSAEPFMENASWVNDLKLRADVGVTGNQNFDNYISLTTYSGFGYYPFEGTWYQVFGPARNPNPDLRWEKGINANIGLDFSILDSRVGGSLNFYRREQQDLLGNYLAPTPPFAHPNVFVNVGTMRNIGFEVEVSANVIRHAGFDYTIDLAASTNDNKFVSFSNSEFQGQSFVEMASLPAPGSPGPIQRLEEGQRIGSFYMYKHAGIDDQGRWLIYDKDDNVILSTEKTIEDRRYVGNGLPKYFLSLSNRFRYGNWDMSVFLRGVFGFDVFNVHDFYYGIPSVPKGQNVLRSAYGKNAGITMEKEPT
ncbi:MAG TPA: TonB-dependent receptor, partial [Anseongella sp.]|nr:TonB-dependent receptor [Anseongella sp.]